MLNQNEGLNFTRTFSGEISKIIDAVSKSLSEQGFGILTRIDFDQKLKEKLSVEIAPTVILGACNPKLAYEAYLREPSVTALLPCNVVFKTGRPGEVTVEIAKPSEMMKLTKNQALVDLAKEADRVLANALDKVTP